jgi:hypothetical protein
MMSEDLERLVVVHEQELLLLDVACMLERVVKSARQFCSREQCFRLASYLRDAADELEREEDDRGLLGHDADRRPPVRIT